MVQVMVLKHKKMRKSSAFGHQTLSDIIPQDKQLWNSFVQVVKRLEENPLDGLHLYQSER